MNHVIRIDPAKLSEGHVRDLNEREDLGTELICNYTDKPYTYKDVNVEPEGYRYF